MEDILASIRRIIADDDGHEPEPQEAISPLKNVLELAERQIAPILQTEARTEDPMGWMERTEVHSNVFPLDASITPVPVAGYESERLTLKPAKYAKPALSAEISPNAEGSLLSEQAEAAVSEAFGRLGSSVPPAAPKSMEDVVREMMRPMLKAWLDDNLPGIVERLVQVEIDRVVRGGR